MSENSNLRRRFLKKFLATTGLSALAAATTAFANDSKAGSDNSTADKGEESMRFPGDPAENKVVYQFNKADEHYHNAVLFSVGAMLRKYGDNIEIVVVGIGPGIHVLAKNPERPVSATVKARISSLAQYGVKFHACGNTMKSLKWSKDNIIDVATIVEVGAADIMELQQKGYAYISW
jgi:uncharacterized protein